jgi:hypothetical protein
VFVKTDLVSVGGIGDTSIAMNTTTATTTMDTKLLTPPSSIQKTSMNTIVFVKKVEYTHEVRYEEFIEYGMWFNDGEEDYGFSKLTMEQRQQVWDQMLKKSTNGTVEDDKKIEEVDETGVWTDNVVEKVYKNACIHVVEEV